MGSTVAATARPPNLFHACLEEALAEAPGLIMRWTNGLQETLRQQEAWTAAPAGKAQLAAALRELATSKTACMERWPAQWRAAIQESVRRRGDVDLPKRSLATVSFDELELMDDSQIQSTVQAARVEQAAKGAAGSVLADLTALLSSVQGFTSVRPENNPVRPEVAIQALRQTLETLCRDATIRDLWLQHGCEALGQELQILYRQLVHWLTQKGVKPADYKVIQTPSALSVGVRHSSGRPRPVGLADQDNLITPQAVAHSPAEAEPSAFLTLDYLHDMLATGPGDLMPQAPAAPASGRASLRGSLRGGIDPAPRPSAPAPARTGAAEEPAHLKALAVEVVNLMLDGMARDPRLLPSVMAQIQRMQPALLRIAADDPRFFVDRGNPARKLLDDITQRNLALSSDDEVGVARLCSTLEDVVGLLQRTDVRVSSLFETALDVLQGLDAQQDAPMSPPTAQAVQSLVQVEQRQLLVERVSKDLRERSDFVTAVPVIQWFLLGPWAQVVAQARLHVVDASSPGARLPASVRYMGVVTDLIWSTRAEVASQGRARLARLIPGLLRTLREGLQTIEYEGQASRQFFAQLMALHEAALKGETPPAEALLAPLDASDGQPLLRPLDVWVRPAEAADSGFMEADFPPLDSDFEDTQPLVREDEAAAPPSPALEVGTWIELHRESGVWVRLRLVWVSPHGLMYLFSGAGRTSSMSRRHFDDMRQAGRVRLLATQSLVDDALDTVMLAALHNTARRSDGRTDYHADHPDLLPPLA